MNRRHFVKISGSSIGALILSDMYAGSAAPVTIAWPEAINVVINGQEYPMQSPDKQRWSYRDISFLLNQTQEGIDLQLYAATSSVEEVRVSWKYQRALTGNVLGDHWERTYGDVHFQPATEVIKMPWYFVQYDGRETHCFGVKTGCSAICSWQLHTAQLQLNLDTRSAGVGVALSGRKLEVATIVVGNNRSGENVFATVQRFCRMMCRNARLPHQPVYGINDWYFTYGKNSAALIHEHTAMMAGMASDSDNPPFSVIDAGWAAYSPLFPDDCCWQDDFSRPNDHFKDMTEVAADIRKLGMRPGLWTRPLCAKHDDPQHRLLPLIPGRADGKKPVLDPTIEENVERVRQNIELYRQWGFEMVKHDFTSFDIFGKWGFEMAKSMTTAGWKFQDNRRTTAEVILHLYRTIREAAGNMYVIGCNTLSHLSAGLFELNRIGDDTSGKEWERTRKMGVNTLGFRMVQHQQFYACDGDCVGLTKAVPWSRNKQWLQLLAASSTPLFISGEREAIGAEQRLAIQESFAKAAKPQAIAEPLDWLTNQVPAKWKLDGQVRTFDWGS